jgi:hypothetical protein
MNVLEQQSWQRMLFGSYTWGFGDVPPAETKKTDPPSRRHHCLLPSFLGLLECTGRDQCQIDPVLKDVTSNAVRQQFALSGAAEPFEQLD